MNEDEWDLVRRTGTSRLGGAGMGALRVALLFGSAAIALGLIVAPIADRATRSQTAGLGAGLDLTSTGSVGSGHLYTIRRSVLQPFPDSVCVIGDNGQRSGDC